MLPADDPRKKLREDSMSGWGAGDNRVKVFKYTLRALLAHIEGKPMAQFRISNDGYDYFKAALGEKGGVS